MDRDWRIDALNPVDYGQHVHYDTRGHALDALAHVVPDPDVKTQRRAQRHEDRERIRKEAKRKAIIAEKSRRRNQGK